MNKIVITVKQDGKEINLCDISKETLEKLREASEPDILVPEGIIGWQLGRTGIINKTQMLVSSPLEAPWLVTSGWGEGKHKLVKCDRKDLVYGDIAYREDSESFVVVDDHERYSLILNDKDYIRWACRVVNIVSSAWAHWYKVTPVGESK